MSTKIDGNGYARDIISSISLGSLVTVQLGAELLYRRFGSSESEVLRVSASTDTRYDAGDIAFSISPGSLSTLRLSAEHLHLRFDSG